jgi:hypothetical protein
MEPSENCPKGCKHETFHYCAESGTHCDKHCICTCPDCVAARKDPSIGTELPGSGGKILPNATVIG